MKSFITHIKDVNPRFQCSKAGSTNGSLDFIAVVRNSPNPPADENKIFQLSEALDETYAELLTFYKELDGVDLYIQDKLPSIRFYPLKQCKTKSKPLKKWFIPFEPEAVNRIKSKGIAFGEVGDSSNVLIYENGQVTCFQWWEGNIELGGLNYFLDNLATDPAAMINKLGCKVRFYDEKDNQWVPREYCHD